MSGSTIGRLVVDVPTNKSGGALAKGDVVVVDTANDHAVTTTTTGASTVPVGVVIEENGIANNATGRVQFAGFVALVNVPASVTRGHYAQTHTVAKQAVGQSARQAGSFGIFTSGGTTPGAYLFGIVDGSTGSGGIAASLIDAKGDLIVGASDNTAARLAAGADGTFAQFMAAATNGVQAAYPAAGLVLSVGPQHPDPTATVAGGSTASRAWATPILIPSRMRLRSCRIRVTGAGSGTHQWGLFDYSASITAATKLAGGTGALNSTGWLDIDASSPPVAVSPGAYMLVVLNPAANVATQSFAGHTSPGSGSRLQESYAWDDTPDFSTGWTASTNVPVLQLVGDIDASNTEWIP